MTFNGGLVMISRGDTRSENPFQAYAGPFVDF